MHRTRVLQCFLLACACDRTASQSPSHPSPSHPSPAEVSTQGSKSNVTVACPSDGAFDFAIQGAKLDAFEGRWVWAVAVERADGSNAKRVVRLQGEIRSGQFALSCPHSLRETLAYPTWAVVIDADGDGACSKADRQQSQQLYGWDAAVNEDVTLHANGEVASWDATVADAHTAVGDRSTFDFCRFYFD